MRRLAVTVVFGLTAFASPATGPSTASTGTESARRVAAGSAHAGPALAPRAPASNAPPPTSTAAPTPDGIEPSELERLAMAAEDAGRTLGAAVSRSARDHRLWHALAQCESRGNPGARSANGKYHGAFQLSIATWRSLGYPGTPAGASYAQQLEAAVRLQARSGWDQWPRCARRLGLR